MEKNKSNNALHQAVTFSYVGINEYGQKLKGEVQATNRLLAKLALRKQGILSPKLARKRKFLWSQKIPNKDITLLLRQLAMLTEAGIPLAKALHILSQSQINAPLKKLIDGFHYDIKTGLTLAESLRKHPHYFNELLCNLINVGEQASTLTIILNNIVLHKEKMEALKKNIKKTLLYPSLLLSIALLVTSALMLFVIPQFDSLFKEFKAELPIYTQIIIKCSHFFQAYWILIGAFFSVSVYALFHAKKCSHSFARKIDLFLLKTPLIGSILKKSAIAGFARTLLITSTAGIPIVKALHSTAKATGNILFSEEIEKISHQIAAGQPMHRAMNSGNLFPHIVIQMIAVGEEACSLEPMLTKIAQKYEDDLDQAVDALNNLLEPVLISLLGVLIGGLVIALYLPLFNLGQLI